MSLISVGWALLPVFVFIVGWALLPVFVFIVGWALLPVSVFIVGWAPVFSQRISLIGRVPNISSQPSGERATG